MIYVKASLTEAVLFTFGWGELERGRQTFHQHFLLVGEIIPRRHPMKMTFRALIVKM